MQFSVASSKSARESAGKILNLESDKNMNYEFKVSTRELIEECSSMLVNQRPFEKGTSLYRTDMNIIKYLDSRFGITSETIGNLHGKNRDAWAARMAGLGRLKSSIGLVSTFLKFDTKWWWHDGAGGVGQSHSQNLKHGVKCSSTCRNQHKVLHSDSGKVVLGTNVNYFAQGVIHYAFGYSYEQTLDQCFWYKDVVKPGLNDIKNDLKKFEFSDIWSAPPPLGPPPCATRQPAKTAPSNLKADDIFFIELGFKHGNRCFQNGAHLNMKNGVASRKARSQRPAMRLPNSNLGGH